jgi:CBS-domain-containing membrane protein
MLSSSNRRPLRPIPKGSLLARPAAIQRRQFLFLVVPVLGAGLAIVVGGAVVIYGMENYRQYQIRKEEAVKSTTAKQTNGDSDKTGHSSAPPRR